MNLITGTYARRRSSRAVTINKIHILQRADHETLGPFNEYEVTKVAQSVPYKVLDRAEVVDPNRGSQPSRFIVSIYVIICA